MTTLSRDFGKYSIPGLIVKGQHIGNSLSTAPGSTYFPTLADDIANVIEAVDTLVDYAGLDKTPANLAMRNAHVTVLIDMLQDLADELEEIADGDEVKLAATGYDINKTPVRHTTPPGTPQNVRVKPTGNPGEAIMRCDTQEQTTFFESRCSLSPSAGPYIAGSTKTSASKCAFTGLERGKDHYFQMRAVNSVGPGPWSDIAIMMVV